MYFNTQTSFICIDNDIYVNNLNHNIEIYERDALMEWMLTTNFKVTL